LGWQIAILRDRSFACISSVKTGGADGAKRLTRGGLAGGIARYHET
jgi:hypothetical protein